VLESLRWCGWRIVVSPARRGQPFDSHLRFARPGVAQISLVHTCSTVVPEHGLFSTKSASIFRLKSLNPNNRAKDVWLANCYVAH
jgi:hypothetical protein